MQNILLNRKDSFKFSFQKDFLKIERAKRKTQKILYKDIVNCELKKGKQQILATIFVFFISFLGGGKLPLKIFKVHDKLIINLKDKKKIEYQVDRATDNELLKKIIIYIKLRIKH